MAGATIGALPADRHGRRINQRGGKVIVIEFPDPDGAQTWYSSGAYQEIVPLRTNNADGWVALFDGVTRPHRSVDVLDAASS